tara:strand:+ start:136 stop:330 length:195 start_codon:yes stop_codon:yes gene_type:complete
LIVILVKTKLALASFVVFTAWLSHKFIPLTTSTVKRKTTLAMVMKMPLQINKVKHIVQTLGEIN